MKEGKQVSGIMQMGPQDRYEGRIRTESLQELQSYPGRTSGIGRLFKGKSGKRIYLTIRIPNGITILLRQKEGWETKTMSRLLISQ